MDMTTLDDIRAATVHFMQHDRNSPLTEEQKRSGLAPMYYEENPALRFSLDLEPYDTQETVEMQTNPGDVAIYLRWGRLLFEMGAVRAQLTVYKDPEGEDYLVSFADATSGIETYGAGWYLEITDQPDGRVLVDFNGKLVGINTMMTGPHVGITVLVHAVKGFLRRSLERSKAPQ